jgi:hypothetical protein
MMRVEWTQTGRVWTGTLPDVTSHTATVRPSIEPEIGRASGWWIGRVDEHRPGSVTLLGEQEQTKHRTPEAARRKAGERLRAAVKEAGR